MFKIGDFIVSTNKIFKARGEVIAITEKSYVVISLFPVMKKFYIAKKDASSIEDKYLGNYSKITT